MEISFRRCLHCFAPKEGPGVCPVCGEKKASPDCLRPGTILKGRYMAGDTLSQTSEDIRYQGWDLLKGDRVEIAEYFPQSLVSRNANQCAVCIPGGESDFEAGKQAFFERAKMFYDCLSSAAKESMDFFVRNDTCYYVRKLKKDATPKA